MDQVRLVQAFNTCFKVSENTVLEGGAEEPWYLPAHANPDAPIAVLRYRADYAASALHEVAHWCLVNKTQRQLPDFGFEYLPPPRTRQEQIAFFKAELRAQSLERVFSQSAGLAFRVSTDDFDPEHEELTAEFEQRVTGYEQTTLQWMTELAGARAWQFNQSILLIDANSADAKAKTTTVAKQSSVVAGSAETPFG